MSLRDQVESTIHAWDEHEQSRGALPIIDFDCLPERGPTVAAPSRLWVYDRLQSLSESADGSREDSLTVSRINADLAYLRALMGERRDFNEYVMATQGCPAAGWPDEYVIAARDTLTDHLANLGIGWNADTQTAMEASEGRLDVKDAPDAIRESTRDLEQIVRRTVGSESPFELAIETVDTDAYWAYWLDGAGPRVRLRLNLRRMRFTAVQARQFALHEVLGHGLQCASLADRCAREDVPWVRILSVHAQHHVLAEGLAQALPLFVTPDDTALIARVRLAHYLQLVRAELHVAINSGAALEQCAAHARARVPFWKDDEIADALADRGANPLLRSYLWSYPAGLDWFMALASAGATVIREVLHAAYRDPLTPGELAGIWPEGPAIGGPGCSVRLWEFAVS